MIRILIARLFFVIALFSPLIAQTIKTVRLDEIPIHDPYILADESSQTYYMYRGMKDPRSENATESVVAMWKSKDLESWTGPYVVFTFPKEFWADKDYGIWAPEVHKYKEKYYLFTTFTSTKDTLEKKEGYPPILKRASEILYADSPSGPFMPFSNKPTAPEGLMTLDGTFWIEDGVPYLIYAHEWIQIMNGTMEAVRLKDNLSDSDGKPIHLFKATDAKWVKSIKDLGEKYRGKIYNGYITDGPFLYKTKEGVLIMIWASFSSTHYSEAIAYSESGKLAGPWKHLDEPILQNDSGHGMIFRTFKGKLMLVFHQPNNMPVSRAKIYELEDTGKLIKIK